jgi:hypothetical protein
MTIEEKRFKLAQHAFSQTQGQEWSLAQALADYFHDLNAVHDLEMKLPRQLNHIDYWQKGYGRFQTILGELTITPYSATAAQRAEAIGKTLNLW